MKIANHRFTVIGIIKPRDERYGQNDDEMVLIPISTGLRFFKGTNKIQSMIIYVRNRHRLNKITRARHQFLIQPHKGVDNIRILNQGELFSWVEQMLLTFRNDLGEIAVIVLLVSGIGNMNIMPVTLTSANQGIGFWKVVRAKRHDSFCNFSLSLRPSA